MALLFDAVKSFFVNILAMGDEATVFGRPCRVGGPLVIEHGVAELVAAAARLLPLALREETVAGTEAAAVAEANPASGDAWLVLDFDVFSVGAEEVLEPLHQVCVVANEGTCAVEERRAIDQVLAEEVA